MIDPDNIKTNEAHSPEPKTAAHETSRPPSKSKEPFAVDTLSVVAALPDRIEPTGNCATPQAGNPVDTKSGTDRIRVLVVVEAAVCLIWIFALPLMSPMVRPATHALFTVPVSGILSGHGAWAIVLVGELVVALTLFRYVTIASARRADLRLNGRVLVRQGIDWDFFVACTAVGIPFAAFPDL